MYHGEILYMFRYIALDLTICKLIIIMITSEKHINQKHTTENNSSSRFLNFRFIFKILIIYAIVMLILIVYAIVTFILLLYAVVMFVEGLNLQLHRI